MENRRKVTDSIILNVPVLPGRFDRYKPGILWEELMKTKDVLPTDIISEIGYRTEKENGFGSMKREDELEDIHIPTLVVKRDRLETDEEFLKRKQSDETFKKQQEEKDKLEYLRLKARFERQ